MTPYRDQDEDDDWDDDSAEYGEGADDSDEESTVPCPYCRREILEDVPQCPYCDRYISAEDHAAPSKPLWIIVTAVACLVVTLWWVLMGV